MKARRLATFGVALGVAAMMGLIVLAGGRAEKDTVRLGDLELVERSLEVRGYFVRAADVNADGHRDLLVAHRPDDAVLVYLGDGKGNLERHAAVPAGPAPGDFAVADLDGDGDLDVVVPNHETELLTLLLGDGRGGFEPGPGSPLTIDVDPHPHTVRVGDVDADGHPDLLVDHRTGHGVLVLRGLGDGEFETSGPVLDLGGDPYRGFAIGDLDGDGRLDLVTPNPASVGVLRSDGSGSGAFRPVSRIDATSPFSVALADVNGDDRLDLVVASGEADDVVQVFLGDGQGGFDEAPESPFRLGRGAKKVVVGDVDGDGLADALVSSWSSGALVILGDAKTLQAHPLAVKGHPWALELADLNEDGRDDLVIIDGARAASRILLSRGG